MQVVKIYPSTHMRTVVAAVQLLQNYSLQGAKSLVVELKSLC